MELISIIIPVYNGEKWIKRCIESILNQTYPNIEIIIINDGSTDNSLDICKKYEKENVTIIDKENSGVSDCRNIGIQNAKGKYLFFIDIDDFIKEETLEELYKIAKKYDADIVKCNYQEIEDSGDAIKETSFEKFREFNIENKQDKDELDSLLINTYKFHNVWGQLILTSQAKKCKFDIDLVMGEDFIYNYEMFSQCKKIVVVPQYYYCYYYNSNGMAFNQNINKIKRKIEDTIYVYKKILENNQNLERDIILSNAIREITRHIVTISTNKEITLKEKKEYLKKIVKDELFKEAGNTIQLHDVELKNSRHKIAAKYLLKGDYNKLYIYLQYIYNPIKRITIWVRGKNEKI